jgi:Protein of unknown function (DUF3105)
MPNPASPKAYRIRPRQPKALAEFESSATPRELFAKSVFFSEDEAASASKAPCYLWRVAKKKSRVPAPPKRAVQAPQPYRAPRDPRRTRMMLIAIGAALVVAAAAAAIAFAVSRGGGDEGAAGALGPCTLQSFPAQGLDNNSQRAGHVTQLPKGFKYNSFPPTSGPHDAQWVIWNVYDSGVPQINLVHNLEHGGIAVQYGANVPEATVDQIVAWYAEDPNGIVVAPLPQLGRRIALTAWTADYDGDPTSPDSRITESQGRLAMCTTFDEDAFSEFRDDYRYEGVERFEPDQLRPGT